MCSRNVPLLQFSMSLNCHGVSEIMISCPRERPETHIKVPSLVRVLFFFVFIWGLPHRRQVSVSLGPTENRVVPVISMRPRSSSWGFIGPGFLSYSPAARWVHGLVVFLVNYSASPSPYFIQFDPLCSYIYSVHHFVPHFCDFDKNCFEQRSTVPS